MAKLTYNDIEITNDGGVTVLPATPENEVGEEDFVLNVGNVAAPAQTFGLRVKGTTKWIWNPTPATVKVRPSVSAGNTRVFNTATRNVEVTWVITSASAVAEALAVDVMVSNSESGDLQADVFTIPVNATSVSKVVIYPESVWSAITAMDLIIQSKSDYTVTSSNSTVVVSSVVPQTTVIPIVSLSGTYTLNSTTGVITIPVVFSISPALEKLTYFNVSRSNTATGVLDVKQFKYPAGSTGETINYSFTLANMDASVTELSFSVLGGEGYTVSAPNKLSYTLPAKLDTINITSYGTNFTYAVNNRTAFVDGLNAAIAANKWFYIAPGQVVRMDTGVTIPPNAKIWNEGEITAYTPNPTANATSTSAGYRLLDWTGANGQYKGEGWINGRFDNSNLNTWGTKLNALSLVATSGANFSTGTSRMRVKNAAGNGVLTSGDMLDAEFDTDDCGYTGVRYNAYSNITCKRISVTGNRVNTNVNSRGTIFIVSTFNNSFIYNLYCPKVIMHNGEMMIEGSLDNADKTRYFPNPVIDYFETDLFTAWRDDNGDILPVRTGKFQNCGVVRIGYFKERGMDSPTRCGGFWLNYNMDELYIDTYDTDRVSMRPADKTHIKEMILRRPGTAFPSNTGMFSRSGLFTVTVDKLTIENNGQTAENTTFGLVNCSTLNIAAGARYIFGVINNVGKPKIALARAISSSTPDDLVQLLTGTFAEQNITVSNSRILV